MRVEDPAKEQEKALQTEIRWEQLNHNLEENLARGTKDSRTWHSRARKNLTIGYDKREINNAPASENLCEGNWTSGGKKEKKNWICGDKEQRKIGPADPTKRTPGQQLTKQRNTREASETTKRNRIGHSRAYARERRNARGRKIDLRRLNQALHRGRREIEEVLQRNLTEPNLVSAKREP